MGTQQKKSPTSIATITPVAAASLAVLMTVAMASRSLAQSGSILPRFTNTVQTAPRAASPSVNMRLAQRGSQEHAPSYSPQYYQRNGGQTNNRQLAPGRLLPARFRGQDGDVFGEDQADTTETVEDAFGEPTIQSPIQESPFVPRTTVPTPRSRDTQIRNPFGEPTFGTDTAPVQPPATERTRQPIIELPSVDPSPRVPPMDTTPVAPRLPQGSQFTPDPSTIPDLPTPGGGTRETDRAQTRPTQRRPGEDVEDTELVELDDFDPRSLETDDPQARRKPKSRSGRTPTAADDPRRPFRSNVYRPAAEPTFYSTPATAGALANQQTAQQAAQQQAANPPFNPYSNPYAANPAANPYLNPYANQYANPYANPYANNPYPPNPYALAANPAWAGLGYGCPPACQGCASCQQPGCGGGCAGGCGNNCGCGTGCSSCSGDDRYAGCPTPTLASRDDGVYQSIGGEDSTLGITGRALNSPLTSTDIPLYYISLFGGWSDLSDLAITNETGQIGLNSRNGVGLGAAFGQIQGRNLRSELEFSYRNHDIDGLFLSDFGGGNQTIDGVGDVESFAGMLNVYWEFTELCGGKLTPYVGAGVGAINVSADLRLDGGQDAFADGEDSSFAYQYIVGINYKVRSYSDLFVEFRHLAADSLRLDTTLPSGSLLDGDGELNYQSNNIFFGMRLKF